jgi:succinate dehydrogenase / fumarate reductase flavoprotein subunit
MKKGREAAIEKHIHNPSDQQIYDLVKAGLKRNTVTYS